MNESIQWKPVDSSHMKAVAYDAVKRELLVKFSEGGDYYAYLDVPQGVHAGLLGASSKGKYLGQFVKGRYKFERRGPGGVVVSTSQQG